MTKRELSKYDFEAICLALNTESKLQTNFVMKETMQDLLHLFTVAHTGWLEIEED